MSEVTRGHKKINVLFVMMQMGMGGSEKLIHNLVLHINQDLYRPHIAWFYGDRVLPEFSDLNVPLYQVPKVRRFDLTTMRLMAKVIKNNDIHVVNAHHFMSMVYAYYGSKVSNNVGLIYTEHSQWEIEKISWRWRTIGTRLLRRVDGLMGVTPEVTGLLRSKFHVGEGKCTVIRNGVDLARLEGGLRQRSIMRHLLGFREEDKVVGIVANLKKIKNHLFLLRAFHQLLQKVDNAKLLLVGQGFHDDPDNTEPELREFVSRNDLNGHVLFLGFRSDIPDLLSAMDVFCLTSFKEGMPISLIEAMAAGLPVVGTDVEGIRDIVIRGETGMLVNNGDVSGFADSLALLLQNGVMRMGMGGRAREIACSEYSLERTVKQYEDLFVSALKTHC